MRMIVPAESIEVRLYFDESNSICRTSSFNGAQEGENNTNGFRMGDLPRHLRACFHTGKLAMLAILVSGGIVLQILACALYHNWWPMLTVLMYVLLPMPLVFFAGSDASSLYSESSSGWVDAAKFFTGASVVGSIAIPVVLKHAGVIGWGALAMELSSFFIFIAAILCFLGTNEEDGYSMF